METDGRPEGGCGQHGWGNLGGVSAGIGHVAVSEFRRQGWWGVCGDGQMVGAAHGQQEGWRLGQPHGRCSGQGLSPTGWLCRELAA